MELPSNVKIGPIQFRIEPLSANSGDIARVNVGAGCIQVDQTYPKDIIAGGMIHEAIHAILRQSGQHEHWENEPLIEALEYGLLSLIHDNPDLIEFIQAAKS